MVIFAPDNNAYVPTDPYPLVATHEGVEIGRRTLNYLEDEPKPEAILETSGETVTEGEPITLIVTLSVPIVIPLYIPVTATGAEGFLAGNSIAPMALAAMQTTITKLKPRWDVHLSGDDDQLG